METKKNWKIANFWVEEELSCANYDDCNCSLTDWQHCRQASKEDEENPCKRVVIEGLFPSFHPCWWREFRIEMKIMCMHTRKLLEFWNCFFDFCNVKTLRSTAMRKSKTIKDSTIHIFSAEIRCCREWNTIETRRWVLSRHKLQLRDSLSLDIFRWIMKIFILAGFLLTLNLPSYSRERDSRLVCGRIKLFD